MNKYKVFARTIVFKEVGTFEANSQDEAIEIAIDEGDVELSLCHSCSEGILEPEIEMFITEKA